MQYIKGLNEFCDESCTAITLGKFDGIHHGHEKLIEKVEECAQKDGLKSVVCAFDMLSFPGKRSGGRSILMTKQERKLRLDGRVDYLVDCPFTKEFSCVEAEDFIKDVLMGLFHASYIIVGTDFSFGHQKRGDIHMLKEYESVYGYQLIVIDKERYHDREISSTYIREVLRDGDMSLVNTLLGYPYRIIGTVEHGKQLGRTLGFPTLNVTPDPDKLLPPNGVYLATVGVDDKFYEGIANIGVKPTVTDENRMLTEVYLFDYEGDAYGKEVTIRLHQFCRPEKKFENVECMKACIDSDIASGKMYFQRVKENLKI